MNTLNNQSKNKPMKNRIYITLTLALLTLAVTVPYTRAQSIYTPYAFTNFAGLPGVAGSADGTGTNAQFYNPHGVGVDTAGNVYVAEDANHTIRKIDTNANVTTLAGTAGVAGSADGTGTNAQFNRPGGVAVDRAGNVYVADYYNHTIRMIDTNANVTTLAGSPGQPGSIDGQGGGALFRYPNSVAVDTAGILYVADELNQLIRKIDTAGNVTTLAGSPGVPGSADGTGSAAQFRYPNGIALDSMGNLYTADTLNHTIRKITPAGVVTTLAGTVGVTGSKDGTGSAAQFNGPRNVAVDSAGNVYVADEGNRTIRKITPAGAVTTLAGSVLVAGIADGVGSAAGFNSPWGVAVDSAGKVYVADMSNNRITKGIALIQPVLLSAQRAYLEATVVSVVFSKPLVAATATTLSNYALNNGDKISQARLNPDGMTVVLTTSPLYNDVTHLLTVNNVQGTNGTTIDPNSQITVLIAGQMPSLSVYTAYAFTNFATLTTNAASWNNPGWGVAVDSAGNAYVAGYLSDTITKITPAGVMTTLAGTTGVAGSADGPGTTAQFYNPSGVAADRAGNAYVADYYNQTIRKIDTAGNVTTLAGSPGQMGSADGTGSDARFHYPNSVAVDTNGNVYVADEFSQEIRKITPAGVVTTLAGSPGVAGAADGVGSVARFSTPSGVAVDRAGNVYTGDYFNNAIRKITPAGVVTTLAGSLGQVGWADGVGSAARFNHPRSVAVDSADNVYVGDEGNQLIRKITPAGVVTTLAGSQGQAGSADGVGSAAQFNIPRGVAVDSAGTVYVVDVNGGRVTKGVIAPLMLVSAARDYLQPTLVSVVFSEPPVAATATKLSNYALNSGGTISGASVNLDGSVVLTTSPLSNNVTHILTVNNVQTAGGLSVATNSQIAVSVPSDTFRAEYGLGGTNSLLVLEAEHYNLNTAGGGSSWIFTTAPPLLLPTDANTNFSGTGAMLAVPVIGRNLGSPALGSVPAGSPRLDFTVQFTNTGTFYVWVRGVGDSAPGPSTNDSVFIGLDDALTTGITGFPLGQGYAWGNSPAGNSGPIVISTPGLHLINVWMREDGFTVDKLLLTSDGGFTPTDLGPAESPVFVPPVIRVGPGITITRSGTNVILSWPGGGTLQSSTNVVGSYLDIPGSSSPFNVPPAGAQKYYRVRQ